MEKNIIKTDELPRVFVPLPFMKIFETEYVLQTGIEITCFSNLLVIVTVGAAEYQII